jgi:hypothetical protein
VVPSHRRLRTTSAHQLLRPSTSLDWHRHRTSQVTRERQIHLRFMETRPTHGSHMVSQRLRKRTDQQRKARLVTCTKLVLGLLGSNSLVVLVCYLDLPLRAWSSVNGSIGSHYHYRWAAATLSGMLDRLQTHRHCINQHRQNRKGSDERW